MEGLPGSARRPAEADLHPGRDEPVDEPERLAPDLATAVGSWQAGGVQQDTRAPPHSRGLHVLAVILRKIVPGADGIVGFQCLLRIPRTVTNMCSFGVGVSG